jgi:hypothetical protein
MEQKSEIEGDRRRFTSKKGENMFFLVLILYLSSCVLGIISLSILLVWVWELAKRISRKVYGFFRTTKENILEDGLEDGLEIKYEVVALWSRSIDIKAFYFFKGTEIGEETKTVLFLDDVDGQIKDLKTYCGKKAAEIIMANRQKQIGIESVSNCLGIPSEETKKCEKYREPTTSEIDWANKKMYPPNIT